MVFAFSPCQAAFLSPCSLSSTSDLQAMSRKTGFLLRLNGNVSILLQNWPSMFGFIQIILNWWFGLVIWGVEPLALVGGARETAKPPIQTTNLQGRGFMVGPFLQLGPKNMLSLGHAHTHGHVHTHTHTDSGRVCTLEFAAVALAKSSWRTKTKTIQLDNLKATHG